ncbi:MAG: 23S rRNA (adenine(2503)-C(2))-methyltransferase RlmN [Candidatus Bipolaricaulota bacterium]|nr:23S rRNA (adenine(2503)-C(2))-methyltransferase RlmN [Candidatus Bipolaricaulota bacterium]
MPMTNDTLLDYSLDELADRVAALDCPRYRAQQIWHAAFVDLAADFDAMSTLPRDLRARLAASLPFAACAVESEIESPDGATRKVVLRLADGETVEVVSMDYSDRATVCVSSQVGCAVGCPFCATGLAGFVRNLSSGEIVAQALHVARELRACERRLTNVVFMGMGEPLANVEAVLRSIRTLNDPRGFGLGARAFTVSTAGVVPGIEQLAEESLQLNLAISLHAGDDTLRNVLVPLNRKYPLDLLMTACRRYLARTHRRISFEIALIAGLNDRPHHARAVAERLENLLCHVNLIPANPLPERRDMRRSPPAAVHAFAEILTTAGIPTTVRDSRGAEIAAGCGQLRARRR